MIQFARGRIKKTFETAFTYPAKLQCSCERLSINQLEEEKVIQQALEKKI